MSIFKTKKLASITIIYWVLLTYIVAALVWWFIALQRQNEKMTLLLLNELKLDDISYIQKAEEILDARDRKNAQYVGEGITFFVLILIGAVFVYRAVRRQLKLSQQQENFMMAVTHELKTPIAITKLNLETLQKRKLEEAQQQKLIGNTLQETERLNSLCNNILLASQFEAGAYKVAKTRVNLSEIVAQSVEKFKTRFPQRKIISNVEERNELKGEEILLKMLVNNLIENAIKYSPKNTLIEVNLMEMSDKISLAVSDEGPGIAEEEKERIFDKFYRVGNETTRTAKGTGLGLYLCKKIAKDHNATIRVSDNNPQGSVFTVTFKT